MTFDEIREYLRYEIPEGQEYTERMLTPALDKVVLRYHDNKGDKFWQCECYEKLLMVNYGKIGTTGRYDIKEFTTPEECRKQAQKLINSKIKNGYTETGDFEEEGHCYYDNENIGISPVSSNPVFRKYCSSDFYYDCKNDYAPFGNDIGNKVLAWVHESCRRFPRFSRGDYARSYLHYECHVPYLAAKQSFRVTDKALLHTAETEIEGKSGKEVMLLSDKVTIAGVLGKFKVKGILERHEIFQLFRALDRMERLNKLLNDKPQTELISILNTIRTDMYCYDRDRYAGQYYSLVTEYDEILHKWKNERISKGRELFEIADGLHGKELAEALYRTTEEILQSGLIPVGFKSKIEVYEVLGSMLGEAICEEYGWSWVDFGEPVPTENGFLEDCPLRSVVSPDKMYSFTPSLLIFGILEQQNIGFDEKNDNTLLLLFNMIPTVDEQIKNTGMKYLPIS